MLVRWLKFVEMQEKLDQVFYGMDMSTYLFPDGFENI